MSDPRSVLSRRQLLRAGALAAAQLALSPAAALAGDIIIGPGRPGTRADLPYRIREYRISLLPGNRLPYTSYALEHLVPTYPQDSNGVIMYRFAGDGKLYYHPVQMASKGLVLVDNYRATGIEAYLTRARAIASKLREVAVSARRGLFLPYRFPIVHGAQFPAPWYSGMAQGLATSLFVRLHETTGRGSDLQTARLLYQTLTVLDRSIKPWVAYVDSSRNLWFEEYPQFPADHVLNGFDFAIFGVYDYYRATLDVAVRRHLQGVLTTVRERVAAYRVPGGVSYYCLGHKVQMLGYHELHVRQLRMLADIANEPYFSSFSDLLAADTGYEGAVKARTQAFVAPLDVPAAGDR